MIPKDSDESQGYHSHLSSQEAAFPTLAGSPETSLPLKLSL